MKLPSKEDFINDTLVKSVMDAKGCDRAAAVELLEAKYRSMEEVMVRQVKLGTTSEMKGVHSD